MTLQEYFPLFAGLWLALAMLVVGIQVIGGYLREYRLRKKSEKDIPPSTVVYPKKGKKYR